MATSDYVAVTGDDWYQRRRQDDVGAFFRRISDQAGRGNRDESGGSTRQGIYCVTASGTLLAFKNAGQPDVVREVLRSGLARWNQLPESERRPGSVTVPEQSKVDSRYTRTPPDRGLIMRVFARLLDRNDSGEWCDAECTVGRGNEAARDHLWLTEHEWKSLIPRSPQVGDQFPLPPAITQRICRFHLIDNTRGEPPMWQLHELRTSSIMLRVQRVTSSQVTIDVNGTVLLATHENLENADRGFDARVSGIIQYDSTRQVIDRFDMVAVGDHWGQGEYTPGARRGRAPLGVAFELASGDTAADLVPPQGIRDEAGYWSKNRR